MGSGYDSRGVKKDPVRGRDYSNWFKKGGRPALGLGTGNKKKNKVIKKEDRS